MRMRLPIRRLLVLGAALACASGGWAQSLAPQPLGLKPQLTALQLRATGSGTDLRQGWQNYKARFIAPEGRVVDDANGGVSHSEGQGYGMLLAVASDDSLTFSRLWSWTAHELYRREDGLASWRWSPDARPHLTDPNNATDGDILIAWALAKAARRWQSPEYAAAARRIALAIGRRATFRSPYGLALKPAVTGFDAVNMADGPVINLSYWVFPAFPDLAAVAPDVDWGALAASGLALLEAARFGPGDLPSEWISLKAAPVPAKAFPPVFGYNAVRIPLYLVWGGLATPSNLAPFTSTVRDGAKPSVVDLSTGLATEPFYDRGYGAVFALAGCASAGDSGLPHAPVTMEHYYSTTLSLLTMVAAQERGLACG